MNIIKKLILEILSYIIFIKIRYYIIIYNK